MIIVWKTALSDILYRFYYDSGDIPEGDGGNPPHESISSDALQVEETTIKKQQQHNVLTEDEALSTLPNNGKVLERWRWSTVNTCLSRFNIPQMIYALVC